MPSRARRGGKQEKECLEQRVVIDHERDRDGHLTTLDHLDCPVHKCIQEEKPRPPALKGFEWIDSASPWLSSGP